MTNCRLRCLEYKTIGITNPKTKSIYLDLYGIRYMHLRSKLP